MLIREVIHEDVNVADDTISVAKDYLIMLRDSGVRKYSTVKFMNRLRDEGYRLRIETLLKILNDIKDSGADYLGSADKNTISLGLPEDLKGDSGEDAGPDIGKLAGNKALQSIKQR